jgi:hypothetical protein
LFPRAVSRWPSGCSAMPLARGRRRERGLHHDAANDEATYHDGCAGCCYTGTKDGRKALDLFAPTSGTKVIDGVRTRVMQDRLYLDNVLEERTADYYAQDSCGNVWYFGEDTAELDRNGKVISTEGSFHAGVNGAQPGVFMEATPEVGRRFRQEWAPGEAEDQFRVPEPRRVGDSPGRSVPACAAHRGDHGPRARRGRQQVLREGHR